MLATQMPRFASVATHAFRFCSTVRDTHSLPNNVSYRDKYGIKYIFIKNMLDGGHPGSCYLQ